MSAKREREGALCYLILLQPFCPAELATHVFHGFFFLLSLLLFFFVGMFRNCWEKKMALDVEG